MRISIMVLAALVGTTPGTQAQSASVGGVIRDQDGRALDGASIEILGTTPDTLASGIRQTIRHDNNGVVTNNLNKIIVSRSGIIVGSQTNPVLVGTGITVIEEQQRFTRIVTNCSRCRIGIGRIIGWQLQIVFALIATRLRASYIDARDTFSSAYKIVVERGTVFLMGRVTEREAIRGTEIARGVANVNKVVKVFEIITEAELAQAQTSVKDQPKPTTNAPNK